MSANPATWLWPLAFYLVGSIPTGYLIGRGCGIDIRKQGSENIGATNVWRVLGRNWGLFAFACDFLKGFLLLFLVRRLEFPEDRSWPTALLLVVCALVAVLGHNYTPWLGFRGGKGVATSAGVFAALLPPALAVVFSLWIILVLITRTVSIGSIAAAAALPFAVAFFYPREWVYLAFALLSAALVIWGHRSNIRRLIAGTEPRMGVAKTAP